MWLHITFADGSNPYVKYGNYDELLRELNKWALNYQLESEWVLGQSGVYGLQVKAREIAPKIQWCPDEPNTTWNAVDGDGRRYELSYQDLINALRNKIEEDTITQSWKDVVFDALERLEYILKPYD